MSARSGVGRWLAYMAGGKRAGDLRAMLADINSGAAVISEINHQILERFAAQEIALPGIARSSQDVYLHRAEAAAPAALPSITPVPAPPADSGPRQEFEGHESGEYGPAGVNNDGRDDTDRD